MIIGVLVTVDDDAGQICKAEIWEVERKRDEVSNDR
jgi:hypothetical protein